MIKKIIYPFVSFSLTLTVTLSVFADPVLPDEPDQIILVQPDTL